MNYQYVAQRLLLALVVVLGITFVVFMIMQIVPGDPARVILGPYASDESVAGCARAWALTVPSLSNIWFGSPGHCAAILGKACSIARRSRRNCLAGSVLH